MNGQNIRIRLKAFDHRILDHVDAGDRLHGQAHRRDQSAVRSRCRRASRRSRQPFAAHRQEVARAVRDPHAQARARHRRSDAADRGRADEARPRRRRGRRDQALSGGLDLRRAARIEPCAQASSPEGRHDPHLHGGRRARAGHRAQARRLPGRRLSAPGEERLRRRCSSASARAKVKNVSKAERGRFAKAQVEPKRKLAEFRVSEDALIDGRRRDHRRPLRPRPVRRRHGHHHRQGLRRRR